MNKIEGKRILVNNKKKYKVVICNDKDNILSFINYILEFILKADIIKYHFIDRKAFYSSIEQHFQKILFLMFSP